jgi:hypothetical protein
LEKDLSKVVERFCKEEVRAYLVYKRLVES